MESTWNRVLKELQGLFKEWSVDSRTKSLHIDFRQDIVSEARTIVTETPELSPQPPPQKMPLAPQDSIRRVLKDGIFGTKHFTIDVHDELGLDYAPSYKFRNRFGEWEYRRKAAFSENSVRELDPFNRFSLDTFPEAEFSFRRWLLSSDETIEGLVMEAVVACHVQQFEDCFNCKRRGCLRWNGGWGTHWQDLVCVECKASYEVKTKATTEKLRRAVDRNQLSGGSFEGFYSLRKSLPSNAKMYVVLIPRSFTVYSGNRRVHPVKIAEIDCVLPRLTKYSFVEMGENLKSSIQIKSHKLDHWFDLPAYREGKLGWGPIVDSLIDELVSVEVRKQLCKKYKFAWRGDTQSVDALQAGLQDMRIGTASAANRKG